MIIPEYFDEQSDQNCGTIACAFKVYTLRDYEYMYSSSIVLNGTEKLYGAIIDNVVVRHQSYIHCNVPWTERDRHLSRKGTVKESYEHFAIRQP